MMPEKMAELVSQRANPSIETLKHQAKLVRTLYVVKGLKQKGE